MALYKFYYYYYYYYYYWKLIARTILAQHVLSLFVAQRPYLYFQGNMGKVYCSPFTSQHIYLHTNLAVIGTSVSASVMSKKHVLYCFLNMTKQHKSLFSMAVILSGWLICLLLGSWNCLPHHVIHDPHRTVCLSVSENTWRLSSSGIPSHDFLTSVVPYLVTVVIFGPSLKSFILKLNDDDDFDYLLTY